jgi:predicted ATP-dependent endonuclease of OLD family
LSAGTAVLIYFILLKNWVELNNKSFLAPEIMLFDEVDSIIHPSLMQNLNEVLKGISKKIQIFITTHSPHFIDCFEKDQVYWLRDTTADTESKTTSNVYSYEEILSKLKKNTEFFKKQTNSKLFIEGLLDSVFPNTHE